jgi:hypothetical protein
MSPRSKANSLLAPCFAENKPNHSIGTPEPLTVCLQQTIDLSILSPKQFVRGTRARARAQAIRASIRTKLGSEKRGKKEKLQTASPSPSHSSSSLPYEDCNGKLTLPKHGRRIQATINCSFFLSQNQIEQKKLLPETFFFLFFLISFFPGDTF